MAPVAAARRGGPIDRGLVAFTLVTIAYEVLFFAGRLPSVEQLTGGMVRRWQFLAPLLTPDQIVPHWFGASGEVAIADRLPLAWTAGVVLLASWSLGMLLLHATRGAEGLARLERFLFELAVGLSATSLYTLALGLAGRTQDRALFMTSAAAVLLSALVLAARAWKSGSRQTVARLADDLPVWRSGWIWLAAPLVVLMALGGMLPPAEFDVREYHLQAPKEFYRTGHITFLPHNVYANMALGSEMHSLLAMTLLGDWWHGALVGKLLESLYPLCTALALAAAGRRWISTRAGGLAAAAYLSIPWIGLVATQGLVEPALAFYVFMSWYAALLWRDAMAAGEASATRRICLAGFLAGSAVAVKYPAMLFLVVPLTLWVMNCARREQGGSRACKAAALLLLFAGAACGAWFAKNWWMTGNPTYPLMYSVFGGATRTAEMAAQWNAAHGPGSFGVADLARRIWDVLVASEWLSPALWPLALLALLVSKRRDLARPMLGYFSFVIATWWMFTHRIDRFWIPALPAICLAAGAAASWASSRWRRVALTALVTLSVVYCGLLLAAGVIADNRFFAPLAQLRVDPQRVAPWRLWLNEHTPPGMAVLAVGDAQVFDLEPRAVYNTVFDASRFEQIVRGADGELRPAAEIRERLAGVAYVYVDWSEIARYRSPGNYGFSDFVQPGVFDELLRRGVLGRPAASFAEGAVVIYPVLEE